ncbi:hypothetical protein AB0F81_06750 [Actinoplanes sp. NPDC024001]|uniref:hypothetical protein n=1 Tax=Actinoplanes sp. NPDC024001 TaxID=3154598 RepID=UPI0033DD0BEB
MSVESEEPLHTIAGQVADLLSQRGYAFVEDDKVDSLAATLQAFLNAAGIPTCRDRPNPVPRRPGVG